MGCHWSSSPLVAANSSKLSHKAQGGEAADFEKKNSFSGTPSITAANMQGMWYTLHVNFLTMMSYNIL